MAKLRRYSSHSCQRDAPAPAYEVSAAHPGEELDHLTAGEPACIQEKQEVEMLDDATF